METGHSVRYRNLMAGYRELPAKETILARIVLFVFVVPWTAYGLYQAFKRDVLGSRRFVDWTGAVPPSEGRASRLAPNVSLGGKWTLARASESGVASITRNEERHYIRQRELPDNWPAARQHFRTLVDEVERRPNDDCDND